MNFNVRITQKCIQVTSEGEKLVVEGENEEEGREAEASSTNSRRTPRGNNSARRTSRPFQRGSPSMRMNPTPIVWSDRSSQRQQGKVFFLFIQKHFENYYLLCVSDETDG